MTERILVTRRPPGRAMDILEKAFEQVMIWQENRPMPHAELTEAITDASGLYSMLNDRLDHALLEKASRLRVISQMAVGVDNIDRAACGRQGIRIGHTPDVLTETTADLGMALILAGGRRIGAGIAEVEAGAWGEWDPAHGLGRDIHGARLGIVGMGRIGWALARRATGFSMDIVYHNRRPAPEADAVGARFVPLGELLATADFVALTCPLTPDTHHLIDAVALGAMRPEAVLVNLARGPVVDTAALTEALATGSIFGAALDVTDPEPLPADHPLVGMPNCLIVPHIGSATVQARAAMAELAARNLIEGLAGNPMPAEFRPSA